MKRGQSQVISLVLIILITIMLVFIVWRVAKSNIEKSEEIDLDAMIVNLNVEKNNVFVNDSLKEIQLTINRGNDKGELSYIKIVIIGDVQEVYTISDYPLSLESKIYVLNTSTIGNPKEILVYPVSEKEKIGIGSKYEISEKEEGDIGEEILVINPDRGNLCISDLKCEEWSVCSAVYDLDSVLTDDVILEGEQSRICIDENECVEDSIETIICNPGISIMVKKIEKCDKEYLEVYNPESVLISRLELINGRLEIQFPLDESQDNNFPYCYNNIKDCDEEGIDCGGSCPAC